MVATEIRIGNWLNYKGKNIKVTKERLKLIHYNGVKGYKPIKINEEILIKCGFSAELEKELSGYVVKSIGGTYFLCSEYMGNAFSFEVKYLHKIQNLFFKLKNEELNVSL